MTLATVQPSNRIRAVVVQRQQHQRNDHERQRHRLNQNPERRRQ